MLVNLPFKIELPGAKSSAIVFVYVEKVNLGSNSFLSSSVTVTVS
jgi:hypothetical protein